MFALVVEPPPESLDDEEFVTERGVRVVLAGGEDAGLLAGPMTGHAGLREFQLAGVALLGVARLTCQPCLPCGRSLPCRLAADAVFACGPWKRLLGSSSLAAGHGQQVGRATPAARQRGRALARGGRGPARCGTAHLSAVPAVRKELALPTRRRCRFRVRAVEAALGFVVARCRPRPTSRPCHTRCAASTAPCCLLPLPAECFVEYQLQQARRE